MVPVTQMPSHYWKRCSISLFYFCGAGVWSAAAARPRCSPPARLPVVICSPIDWDREASPLAPPPPSHTLFRRHQPVISWSETEVFYYEAIDFYLNSLRYHRRAAVALRRAEAKAIGGSIGTRASGRMSPCQRRGERCVPELRRKKKKKQRKGGKNGFRAILSIFSLFDLFSDAVTSGMRRSLVQRSVFFLDVGAGFLL